MKFIKAIFICATLAASLSTNAAFINFDDYNINGFAGQDVNGSASTSGFGLSLDLDGNTWVSISDLFEIDATSVLYFSFEAAGPQAELYGIGFDNDSSVTAATLFDIGGTEANNANQFYDYVSGDGRVDFAIDVGSFFSGTFSKLVFILDADNVAGTSASFLDVELCSSNSFCESTSLQSVAQVNSPSALLIFCLGFGLLVSRCFRK